jgi:hypothetical protein
MRIPVCRRLALFVAAGCFFCLGCSNGPQTPELPTQVAEFKFSSGDLRGDSFSSAVRLERGKEAWVGVDMHDSPDWPSLAPTGPGNDNEVLPTCRLRVAGDNKPSIETMRVVGGHPPTPPGMTPGARSMSHRRIVAFGTMTSRFESSYMELKFVPTESGQYNIDFQHAFLPPQQGYRQYRIRVYQQK